MSCKPRRISYLIGIFLLIFATSLVLFLRNAVNLSSTSPPTILGVTIREGRINGGLVFYQEIDFYDEDGNTNLLKLELVDLSDPSEHQYMQLEDTPIDALTQIQKIRATATKIWRCEGHTYHATLDASLSDRDGNRSKAVRYRIECK